MYRDNIGAVVLAAGLCRRMGRFKPLLDLGGRPVIARTVEIFRSAGIVDIRVVIGYAREEITPVLENMGIQTVVNERYEEGMFSSVLAGIASLGAGVEAFFLLPADMPLIQPDTVRYLMAEAEHFPEKVIVPTFRSRRGHPPVIPVKFVDYITRYSGNNGLSGAIRSLGEAVISVEVNDENTVFDFDTEEAYCELKRRWRLIHDSQVGKTLPLVQA